MIVNTMYVLTSSFETPPFHFIPKHSHPVLSSHHYPLYKFKEIWKNKKENTSLMSSLSKIFKSEGRINIFLWFHAPSLFLEADDDEENEYVQGRLSNATE